MGEVVFIDSKTTGDMDKVPEAVKTALRNQSGSLPQVALSDSTGAKVYGTASHAELKGGLDKALKDAKRAMREDQRNGTAPAAGAAPAAKPNGSETPAESSSAGPGETKVVDNKGTKEITGAPLEQWTSSKGSSVTARITKVAGPKVTLVTDKGKTITLGQADLAPASYERLQEILTAK